MKPESKIVIAGSGRGIGRALAENLAADGHTVYGLSRNPSDLEHPHYRHLCADVTDEEAMKQAFAEIGSAASGVDVMIYSAGLKVNSYLMLSTCNDAARMLQTNLLGAFLATRQAVRLMKRNRFGRVIYLSSVLVPLGSAGSAIYSATKSALEQLAFSLSHEFANENITFNCLGISIFPTGMIEAMSEKVMADTRAALVKSETLTIEEIAAAVRFFASPDARQITGQTLYFGGVR